MTKRDAALENACGGEIICSRTQSAARSALEEAELIGGRQRMWTME